MYDIQTNSRIVSATPTLANAGAYTAGDVVGTLVTFSKPARQPGSGVILSVVITDLAKQSVDLDVIFFNLNPAATTFTDNAALDIPDADLTKVCGHVSITADDYTALNDNSFATKGGIGLVFQVPDWTYDLYAVIVARGTPTYASGDVSLQVGLLLD